MEWDEKSLKQKRTDVSFGFCSLFFGPQNQLQTYILCELIHASRYVEKHTTNMQNENKSQYYTVKEMELRIVLNESYQKGWVNMGLKCSSQVSRCVN